MDKELKIRPANFEDYVALANFLSFEYFIHRHLDWRSALDWLGRQPFLIAERNHEIVACFAAPNDAPDSTWVRLFACSATQAREEIWEMFLEKALAILDSNIKVIAALGIENWFKNMIGKSRFALTQEIIVLERNEPEPVNPKLGKAFFLRKMDPGDLPEVAELDRCCFPSLWQMPVETMEFAYAQSGYSTVIEQGERIIGYQISTEALSSAHLARISVHPSLQAQGIAGALLADLINNYQKMDITRITVNTQNDNLASQMLYKKYGFRLLPEHYPVYTFQI
jgi:ribosomal protein S18 acetylase RimI-like enzyme